MVLWKWAAATRSPPPLAGILPRPKTVPRHPRLKPAEYKTPNVLRPFIRDRQLSELQHLENRGMYREELLVERSRFPKLRKTLVIQSDGSLNEREFEVNVPPLMLCFLDRLVAHRQRQVALAKIAKLKKPRGWEAAAVEGKEDWYQRAEIPVCNALTWPYCVPKNLVRRERMSDPLTLKKN